MPPALLFPPADKTPYVWPEANFTDPETRGWAGPTAVLAMFSVSVVVFAARVRARFWVTRKAGGVDDWIVVLGAMPGLLALTVVAVLGLGVFGFQLHIWDQTPRSRVTIRQVTLAMEITYLYTTTLTKISILTFCRRMTSCIISRPMIITIWLSIIFVAIYGIGSILALIFSCHPVEAYWYRLTPIWLDTHAWKCHDELLTLLVLISVSTLQDLITVVLPLTIVTNLRLPLLQKTTLASVFLIGLATCGTGVLRLVFVYQIYSHTHLNPNPTYDLSWAVFPSWLATAAEANLSLICASAPALKVYWGPWVSGRAQASFGWYGGRRGGEMEAGNGDLDPVSVNK